MASTPSVTNLQLLELQHVYSATSGVNTFLDEMLRMNELEMEKGLMINTTDLEQYHIKANENFAIDYSKSIKDRCREI